MRLSWSQPEDLVAHEILASAEEGKDVTAARAAWTTLGGSLEPDRNGASPATGTAAQRAGALQIIDELDQQPNPNDDGRPASWAAFADSLPAQPAIVWAGTSLEDKLDGAWFGRAAGCLLGKPVEKIPADGIRELLSSAGRWPLRFYFSAEGVPDAVRQRWPWNRRSGPTSLVENIDGMPEDDDLNYPILNLQVLEQHGPDFTVEDIAAAWLNDLPAGRVFTAERAAYRNLLEGVSPDDAAARRNPFREWIGALIRADVFGWVNPGRPIDAARAAYEEARLSHTGNGIYGATWVAAMSAAALVTDDVELVLAVGDAAIPVGSELAAAVAFGRELGHAGGSLDDDLAALHDRYGQLHWVHVLNNAATIAWALTRGAGQFDDAVPLAVMAGWDTDSAAATVGALCGALNGKAQLDPRWTDPLHDQIATSLPGLNGVRISELAKRTHHLATKEQHV